MEKSEVDIDAIKKITDDTDFWMRDLGRTRTVRKSVQSRLDNDTDPILFVSTESLEHRQGRINFEREELIKILDDHEAHVIKLLEAQGNKLTAITNVDDEELDYDDMMELKERRKNGK